MFIRGGGLGLGSTVIIAISASNVAVAESQRNQLNQIYWRFKANNIMNYPYLDKKFAWIKDERYWDSIVKVIGKAVGDCVTGEGVFENKRANDLILFKDTDPLQYTPANWNAVVLYNYVFRYLSSEEDTDILNNVFKTLSAQYKSIWNKKPLVVKTEGQAADDSKTVSQMISNACRDIAAYADALRMKGVLDAIKDAALRFANNNGSKVEDWAPRLVTSPFDSNANKFFFSDENRTAYLLNNRVLKYVPARTVMFADNPMIFNYQPTFINDSDVWHITSMYRTACRITDDKSSYEEMISGQVNLKRLTPQDQYVFKLLEGLVAPSSEN